MNLKTLAIAAGIAASFIVTAILVPDASADRTVTDAKGTITTRSSSVKFKSARFLRDGTGKMHVDVCARAFQLDGGTTVDTCYEISLSAAAETKANELADGALINGWKAQEGL